MPDYHYRCQGCYHVFEMTLSVYESATVLCPICEDKASRLIRESPALMTGKKTQASSSHADIEGSKVLEDADSTGCGCVLKHCFHSTQTLVDIKEDH